MTTLNLGAVGNCGFSALIDPKGRVVWCCLPRFDGDPVFNTLLAGVEDPDEGMFSIELDGLVETEQSYDPKTAILRTRLHGSSGSLEIVDFAPRFFWRDRIFRPQTLIRRLRPISGTPRITVRMRPTFAHGTVRPQKTRGSNHIRYVGPDMTLRVSTDAPLDYVIDETSFNLTTPVDFILGPDETIEGDVTNTAHDFEERTCKYWYNWVSSLALPFEWQEAVIRAAITLKLCTYEPTGAIIAAMTTSIPEAPDSGRNWDYRYCWVRDAFFVVRALNSLGTVQTMENYFRYLMDLVADADGGHIQPVYGIGRESQLTESILDNFSGYRGMGPVRIGNQAYEHYQHDAYGNVILGAAQIFFDKRIQMKPSLSDFQLLEVAGEQAYKLHNTPDAGMWELRSRSRVHTSSSLMCWAACDRLAHIASSLGENARVRYWRERAEEIRQRILTEAWSEKRKAFVESFGGNTLDASILLMAEVGFIDPRDPRFVSTVDQLEKALATGPYMKRYEAADDFGPPEVSFNICAFWRLDALARIGRDEEAREIFEALLETRNSLGMLSEDTHPVTGEMWGNFPQTYSMVGIINGARRLSKPWESVV
ncbi:glycoside hydrolase family 15 protein [Chelativorans sp. YIM 93263]|uniref:glycoside hydrolase family 15 protein n=1 Tax=Chelativorans sp. YIM 93263 TaxID=2906648 RepID=UPI0023799516|nr:glycoside hydrolase family 15 protein [Chelativorans sp. YIM 93263]